jgi:hypothetical protein
MSAKCGERMLGARTLMHTSRYSYQTQTVDLNGAFSMQMSDTQRAMISDYASVSIDAQDRGTHTRSC